MRILHVVEATFAGVGRHVVDLARAQADAGHDVLVLYGTVRESDRFRRGRKRSEGVQWRPMKVARRPDGSDLKAVQTVRALARGFRPHVVHGHSTKGGMLARAVPKGAWRVVYTPHAVYSMNPELGRRARGGVDRLERGMSNRTDVIIAVSPEEETHLRLMGIEQTKLRMIPNGVRPLARANPVLVRRALNLPLDRPVIGFVGRIDDQKAPHTLLDVFKRVAVARPRVDFVVVGDGELRRALQDRADISRALAGRVHLVGEQPGPWAMAGMDVLALPSRYEGMPYVLLEAAHLGLPMVVTEAAGSSLLQDGPSTIKVAPVGDVVALAQHCVELVDAWPHGRHAPDRRFTLEGMVQLTELAYRGQDIDLRETRLPVRETPPAKPPERTTPPGPSSATTPARRFDHPAFDRPTTQLPAIDPDYPPAGFPDAPVSTTVPTVDPVVNGNGVGPHH
jgi:glycosyltransferase involved in cell wall biosynthesis